MINDKKFTQKGGENSVNYQSEAITVYNGISYADARNIALDVFKSNFLELSQKANELAQQRAEELSDNFLHKLNSEKPDKIGLIEDPDLQYALYTAQKEYARTGEKEMEDMLVNILLERIDEHTHSLRKIVLNEALEVIPKLTDQQLDILTIIFLMQDTKSNNISNSDKLKHHFEQNLLPFIGNLTNNKSCYKHLEYTGCCGTIGVAEDNLSQFFINNYKGLFSNGFKKVDFEKLSGGDSSLSSLLITCLNNQELFQLNILNETELRNKIITDLKKSESVFNNFNELFKKSTMTLDEANKFIISLVPEMNNLIDTWKNSYMCTMNPTSVGTALAHINYTRKTGIKLDLSIWIK